MLNVVWKSGHQSKPIHCIHLDWIVQCSSIWCYLFKQKYFSYGKQRIVVYRNLFSKCPSSCLSTLCKTSFKTSILLKVNPTLHRGAHYGPLSTLKLHSSNVQQEVLVWSNLQINLVTWVPTMTMTQKIFFEFCMLWRKDQKQPV